VIPGEAQAPQKATWLPKTGAGRPLGQLLHALNQPLTGLQCSMEVALAAPRTAEQYVQGLREGLELTERMRALVEAIREVVAGEEEKFDDEELATIELKAVLREVVEELGPVAEVQNVGITVDCCGDTSLAAKAGRRGLATTVFRLLESALSLAAGGSALRIETGGAPAGIWIRIRWHAGASGAAFSRPELGLLVAQAGWERAGAKWERERSENLETVTVRLPGVVESSLHGA
jgi:hypothetical protein